MRDIKRRVRAVSNIRQITRAMELVASTKMRRARELLNKTRPYSQTIEDVIDDIITYIREDERYKEEGEKYKHSLMDIREVKRLVIL
jgi:F-type H+-transporting ATPase subunit gamma